MSQFRKSLMIEILIALIIVGALLGGIFFFRGKIGDAAKAVIATRQQLFERQESLKSFNLLKTQHDGKARQYINNINNLLPKYEELINLQQEFENFTATAGLDPRPGLTYIGEETATPASLGRVKYNLTVRGDRTDQVFNFVQSLQRFRYLMTIDSFTLDRQGSRVLMNIKTQVFFRS